MGKLKTRKRKKTALATTAQGSVLDTVKKTGKTLEEVLRDIDALVGMDVSGSMNDKDGPDGVSRFKAADQELRNLQADYPGKIGVIQFSREATWVPSGVPELVGATTNLSAALKEMHVFDNTDVKLFVITDGEPNNEARCLKLAATFTSKINTIFIGKGEGEEFLRRLAGATGGIFAKSKEPGLLGEPMRLMLTASF